MSEIIRKVQNHKYTLTCQKCGRNYESSSLRSMQCDDCITAEVRRLGGIENGAASKLTTPLPFGVSSLAETTGSCQLSNTPLENGKPDRQPRFPSAQESGQTPECQDHGHSSPENGPLGKTTTYPTPPTRLMAAFKLLKPLHKLYKRDHQSDNPVLNHGNSGWPHRSSYCYERVLSNHLGAELRRSKDDQSRVGFGNIQHCGNIHTCPVCGYIANVRWQSDLQQVEDHLRETGHRLLLFVLTISHKNKDALAHELDILRQSYSELFTQRKKSQKKRAERWGIVGRYRAWDITYGKNGWHAHVNVIVAVDPGHAHYAIEDIHADFDRVYRRHVAKAGGFASMEHGLSVSEYKNGKCYSVKTGMDGISIITAGKHWTITHEAISKNKHQAGIDIGALRAVLRIGTYHGDGYSVTRSQAENLCLEYAATMSGERSVITAGVMRDELALVRGGELSDDQLSEMLPDENYIVEGVISDRDWAEKIIGADYLADLIGHMRAGREQMTIYLQSIGIQLIPSLTAKEAAAQSSYRWRDRQIRKQEIDALENRIERWDTLNGINDLDEFL